MANPIQLKLDRLSCSREQRQLFIDLSFTATGGQLIKIEGPNGSGKTTLLNVIAGLTRRYEGQLQLTGCDQTRPLYLSHALGFSERLNVIDNLHYMARARLLCCRGIEAAIDRVGLTQVEHQPLRNLSAGQRRRVGLALLCVDTSPLVLLDEPYNAIDQQGRALVDELIADKLANNALIFITHHQALDLPHQVLALDQFVGLENV